MAGFNSKKENRKISELEVRAIESANLNNKETKTNKTASGT